MADVSTKKSTTVRERMRFTREDMQAVLIEHALKKFSDLNGSPSWAQLFWEWDADGQALTVMRESVCVDFDGPVGSIVVSDVRGGQSG